MIKKMRTSLLLLLALSSGSCNFRPAIETPPPSRHPWTVILYFGMDNIQFGAFPTDLWGLTKHLVAGASSLSRAQTPILLLYDGRGTGDSQILELSTRTVVPDGGAVIKSGEVNYGDPQVMADFIIWAGRRYPADHYLLGLCHHYGWQGYNTDESSPGPLGMDIMTLPEHAEAMAAVRRAGIKIDVIWFEACSITMIETLYQYAADADYVVGNEDTIDFYELVRRVPGMMSWMRKNPAAAPQAVARELVNQTPLNTPSLLTNQFLPLEYALAPKSPGGKTRLGRLGSTWLPTQFAFKGREVKAVALAVDRLARVLAADLERWRPALERSRRRAKEYTLCPWYIDLYDFCRLLARESSDPGTKAACQEVMRAVESAVEAQRLIRGDQRRHGILILFPLTAQEWKTESVNRFDPQNHYQDLAFARDTYWDEFLDSYFARKESGRPSDNASSR